MTEPSQKIKKIHLTNLKYEYFYTTKDINYLLLFFAEEIVCFRILMNGENRKSSFQRKDTEIIDVHYQKEKIYILESTGIRVLSFSEPFIGQPLHHFKLTPQIVPQRIITLDKNIFALTSKDFILFFDGKSVANNIPLFSEFNMAKITVNTHVSNDSDPFVLVGSNKHRFPYVFTLDEAKKWNRINYFERVKQACEQYYQDDEVLTNQEQFYDFCMSRKLVVAACTSEICVLSLEQIDSPHLRYALNFRLRVKLSNGDLISTNFNPQFLSSSWITSKVVTNQSPLLYKSKEKGTTINQKSNSMITKAYMTSSRNMILLGKDCEKNITKLYFFNS